MKEKITFTLGRSTHIGNTELLCVHLHSATGRKGKLLTTQLYHSICQQTYTNDAVYRRGKCIVDRIHCQYDSQPPTNNKGSMQIVIWCYRYL